ncbi:42718_t:CDS:2 [Gigaspora margarita]|uniref:42718_t:CDS:1 n=1 Tax=Gigaspora margarita TaxID=4874 RepID=A0ABN7V4A8_GIGMA|nr:42718_t:CDS:2 [Gigaspora margarita]
MILIFTLALLRITCHIIRKHGIATDSAKIEAVKNFSILKNLKQLRGFLELASYYRKFIKNFTSITTSLTEY